ncbi:MAG TPA: ATP-binding protein [Polyangiales bacterium]
MPHVLSTLSERLDLEKKLALWFFGLLTLACVVYALLAAQRTPVIETVALLLGVFAAMAIVAHWMLFKPVRQLVLMAKAVGSGDFSKRLRLARHDEIGELGDEMDLMCDQLQAAQLASEAHVAALDQLRHSDRVATLGRLASSVAHELGNPLNVIELRAQLIASGDVTTLAAAQQSAAVIVEQTHRMTRIIDEVLSFARVHPAKLARVDLVGVVRTAISLCQHTAKKRKTRILPELPEGANELDGDADKLLQVIVNLVMNGVQAMPDGGTLRVKLCSERRGPAHDPAGTPRDYACIEVIDEGVGIPEQLLPKVFAPFFSTKSETGGTGLGLSVAQGIAQEHDGWIGVTSELGHGSSFKVYLPKHGAQSGSVHAS